MPTATAGMIREKQPGVRPVVELWRAGARVGAGLLDRWEVTLYGDLRKDHGVNVARTALQLVLELRLNVPVNDPVEETATVSLAARDVLIFCCCST